MRAGDGGDDPPVGLRLAGQRPEGALARDAALGVRHRAVLLAPGGGRQQHVGDGGGVGAPHHIGDGDERAGLERRTDEVGLGQAVDGVRRHDPDRLHPPVGNGAEQVDGLEAGALGDARTSPEALHQFPVGGAVEFQMGGELVRQPADLAPAHGVGLAGDRERPHPRPADAACGEVAVDDGVTLSVPESDWFTPCE